MSGHRVDRRRPARRPWWLPVAWALLVVAAAANVVGLVVTLDRAFADPDRVPAVHTMTVYDDDVERGQRRCEAWGSLYSPGASECVVNTPDAAMSPQRAREGQQWWQDRYPADDRPFPEPDPEGRPIP